MMLIFRAAVLGTASFSVAACASSQWMPYDPAITPQMAQQAMLECEYQAKLGTPDTSSGVGLGNAIGDGIAQGLRIAELKNLCMQTKGFYLQRMQ